MQIDAADEIRRLRSTVADLLEILRNWEPDCASADERLKIVRATHQIEVLPDPIKSLRNMTEADFDEAHGIITNAEINRQREAD